MEEIAKVRSALEYAGDGASSADVRQQALGFLEEWKQEKEVCRRAMAMGEWPCEPRARDCAAIPTVFGSIPG